MPAYVCSVGARCHTIVATTPTARVALVVTFAGLASADNRVAEPDALIHSRHPIAFSEHPSAGPQDAQAPNGKPSDRQCAESKRTDCKRARRLSGRLQGDAHLAPMVSWAPSSATKMASRLAGSVALAFSLTRCSLPGGSKKVSPAL